jgi:3-methyladenine DNA glycosylase/8-oxoguanine DNA glycosylase
MVIAAAEASASVECATDLAGSLGVLRRGPGDPTYLTAADGAIWRAAFTPDGPGTARICRDGPLVHVDCWGPGGGWLARGARALVGLDDDHAGFAALAETHPLLREAYRRYAGLRLISSGLVISSLIPAILEQKVTTKEAFSAWILLVRRYGTPAPGPAPEGLYAPPSPRAWALIPSWEWHRAGVDAKRSGTIMRVVRAASAVERCAGVPAEQAAARLRSISGIGAWTAAETLQRSHGAADALSVGDFHLCKQIGYVLTGEREADDARMLELLEPFRPHRHRAARLLLLAGPHRPRHGPRLAPSPHRFF